MQDLFTMFPRLNNRRARVYIADMVAAGYPTLQLPDNIRLPWPKLHKEAHKVFNYKGKRTYVWFGDHFFFQTEEDKTKFILLFC